MNIFLVVFFGCLAALFGVLTFYLDLDWSLTEADDVKLEGLNQSEIFLSEGDLCSNNGGPSCKFGLECVTHPDFPDFDGQCKKVQNKSIPQSIKRTD